MPRERKQIGLRLPDHLAGQVTDAAHAEGISINRWITRAVAHVLDVGAELDNWENEKARLTAARSMLSSMPTRVADAHADRYPPTRGSLVTEIQHEPVTQPGSNMCTCGLPVRDEGVHPYTPPVGSFDPDTDTPA